MEKSELEQQVNDIIHCFICFGKVYKPYMCPKCHKLYCLDCLKKWYSKGGQNCAMCKTILNFDKFIPIPWMDDLSNYMIQEQSKVNKKKMKIQKIQFYLIMMMKKLHQMNHKMKVMMKKKIIVLRLVILIMIMIYNIIVLNVIKIIAVIVFYSQKMIFKIIIMTIMKSLLVIIYVTFILIMI